MGDSLLHSFDLFFHGWRIVFLSVVAATFFACGGDSGDSGSTINGADVGVKTEEDLPDCNANLEGKKMYVQDADGYFLCMNYFWDPVSSRPVCNAQTFHTVARERNKALYNYNDVYACDTLRGYSDSLAWRVATSPEIAGGTVCDSTKYGLYATDSIGRNSYMCSVPEDSSETGYEWRDATAAETLTHKICDKSREKSIFISYDTTDGSRVAYICESGAWNFASSGEAAAMESCTDKIQGSFVYDTAGRQNDIYVCDSLIWRSATDAEIKAGTLCVESAQGEFVSVKTATYVCDSLQWREANPGEIISRSLCTDEEQGRFVKADNNIDEYVCNEGQWRGASTGEKITGKLCTVADQGVYKVAGKYSFICDSSSWRSASIYERTGGGLCTVENYGTIVFGTMTYSGKDSTFYLCDSSGWREATKTETATRALCTAKLEGEYIIKDSSANGIVYVCERNTWRTTNMGEIKTGAVCNATNVGDTINWYKCYTNGWYLMNFPSYGACTLENDGTTAVQKNPNVTGYGDTVVCDSTHWRSENASEKLLNRTCTYSKRDEIYNYYNCTNTGWIQDTSASVGSCYFGLQSTVATEKNPHRKDYGTKYVCDSLRWQLATEYEFNGDLPCTSYMGGTVYNSKVCKLGSWTTATAAEISMGKACTIENDGQLYNNTYVCIAGNWQSATENDIAYGGRCYVNTDSIYFASGYFCIHDTWKEANTATKIAGVSCNKNYYGILIKDVNHVLGDTGTAYVYCGPYQGGWIKADSITTLLGQACYQPDPGNGTTYYAEHDGVTYTCPFNGTVWHIKK